MTGFIFPLFLVLRLGFADNLAACDSPIYCDGPLLHAVQMARIFPDGKTFVDMHLKEDPGVVLAAFNSLLNTTKDTLERFVAQYFSGPGEELEQWQPTDYVKLPTFLNDIKDPMLKDFGWDLCSIWKDLGRKIKEDVKIRPNRYSMVYLPHPFIVPGGRFRETFYWDSYWVIKGLLICEMNSTVKGMLENFIHYIQTYGFIPNGGRTYFTRRSQPPFFISMVYEYYKATNDLEFIKQSLPMMEAEYNFWQGNRSVEVKQEGKIYKLNQYRSNVVKPRPESYYEDVATSQLKNESDRPLLYSHLVSACESGWDFSSRWFSQDNNQNLTLDTIETMNVVPVDLNSILCMNEQILSKFYQVIGNNSRASYFNQKFTERRLAIEAIFYNEEAGIWQDYSLRTNSSRNYFYMSNIFPIYMNCTSMNGTKVEKLQQYIKKHRIEDYKGGIPTSEEATGQQWDYPNGWSPLEQVLIWSLDRIPETKGLAEDVATKWLQSNFKGWQRTRGMFEKYDVLNPGTRGGGGEYDMQEGFGWTNGVALEILQKYGKSMKSDLLPKDNDNCSTNTCNKLKAKLIVILFTVLLTCRAILIDIRLSL